MCTFLFYIRVRLILSRVLPCFQRFDVFSVGALYVLPLPSISFGITLGVSIWESVLSYAFGLSCIAFYVCYCSGFVLRFRTSCVKHLLLWLSCHVALHVLFVVAIASFSVCASISWDLILV